MATTRIDTDAVPRRRVPGQGEVAEVLNQELAGAQRVACSLRWLDSGEALPTPVLEDAHQLIYVMEGEALITLAAQEHPAAAGAGIYLGPVETAVIRPRGASPLKLFHIVVPIERGR